MIFLGPDTRIDDMRPMRVSAVENVSVDHGAVLNLLTVAPGTAGTVTMVQMVIIPASSDAGATLGSELRVMANGVASPGEHLSIENFYMMTGYTTPSLSWVGPGCDLSDIRIGCYRFVEIPFTNGISIDLLNGSSSNAATIFSQITWRLGMDPLIAAGASNRRNWHVNAITGQSTAHYVSTDLLPTVTDAGEIEAIALSVDSNTSYSYMEGNPSIIMDGSAQTWGGTEDYFGGQFYFNNGANGFQQDQWGGRFSIPGKGTYASILYRKQYPYARLNFQSSARIAWPNGQSGEAGDPGTVTLNSLVTYWTKT